MISNLVTQKKYTSSPGGYKGVTINPGTDADIARQMREIDARTPNPATTPLASTSTKASQGVGNTQPKAVKGLIPDPKSTLSYDRLVGGLAEVSRPSTVQQKLNESLVSASKPTNTQTGLIGDLRGTARGNFGIGEEARRISDQYAPEIARVGGLGAAAQAGYNSSGTNVVGAGNAAIASQSASQRMAALAQGQEAALKGTAQQLTAQEQAAGAFGTALGGANTQQAQQLSGLGQAANLAQPQVAAYGQTVFNPLTGEYEGNGGLPPEVMQQYAQMAANGQYAAIPSSITSNPVLSAQLNVLAQQMNPGYNPIASTAYGNVASTNIQNLGTAQTAGQAAGIQALAGAGGIGQAQGMQAIAAAPGITQAGQYGQIAAYKSSMQQGQQLAAQLDDLLRTFNLNPSNVNVVNAGIQKIAANTSDPQYQMLSNYLADVASRYAQVLTPPGGSATDMTRSIASSMINATASGKSIRDVLQSLDQQAQAVIDAVPASGSVPGSSGQYKEGDTRTSGGYTFIMSNGKWIPR